MENARRELQDQAQEYLRALQQTGTKWCHPGVDDILFEAHYLYKHYSDASAGCSCFRSDSPDQICEEALGKDYNNLDYDQSQQVRCRQALEAIPASLYIRPIASADTVMKSRQHRDEIVKREKVIGFKIEGAGVWDNIPCIIIKGVCDYADSHKSKVWQTYTAATGASATKAFLEYWMPAKQYDKSRNRHLMIPFARNSHFVGRQKEIQELEDLISAPDGPRKLGITGLGGVGKSQIALELAYRMRDREPGCPIFWIPCTSYEAVEQAFMTVAEIVGIQDVKPAEVKERLKAYLSQNGGKWLLIFDNADDMDMWTKGSNIFPALKNCLPQSQQGRILFTTRNRILAVKLASPHVLPVAEPDEVTGLKILENSLIDGELLINDNTSIQLLNKLTFLPLAIAQAAAYISENAIKISQYVELLEEQESRVIDLLSEDFEDEGRYETTQNPVATTWWISFQHIQQHNQLAADYLSFMACIDPRDIPHSLLPKAPTRNEGVKAMGLLKAYAFITEQTGDNSLSLHRLVHLATRTWLRKNHRFTKCLYGAAERLDEVFPDDNFTNRKLWQAYISHALAVFKEKGFRNRRERYIGLMQKIAQCLYSDGRYKEAETLFADIVRIQYERHGQNNAATLANMTRLASTYGNLGRWNDAERLEEQVLNTYSEILGPQNPTTLSSLANLASIYQSQGRWIEAKVLQSRVMRMYKKTLGPEHANTLISTHNLALTYNHLGKFHASENLLVKVNGRWMQILGPEHPHTLTSMNSLAFVHQSQRQWKKAEGLFLKVMETRKQILGPHHPHTLTSMHNLASTYQSQEKWKEAEKLLVEVLRTSQLVLGPQHPDTLASMSALVHTLRSRGKESAALSLMNEGIRLSSVTHKGRLINSTGDEQHAAWEEEIEMTRASKIASLNNTTAASSPFFSHERYTIAVVCTLLQEATTVRTMLDEIHLTPVWITDPNIYALGELNGHYVVVVCLSGGVNSTASAATAMSSIHLTFPRLKFAMVVGICGGIPQQANDIRLGDVVVSAPRQSNTIRIAAGLRLFPEAAND